MRDVVTVHRHGIGRSGKSVLFGRFKSLTAADKAIAAKRASDVGLNGRKPTYAITLRRTPGTILDDVIEQEFIRRVNEAHPGVSGQAMAALVRYERERVGISRDDLFALVREKEAALGERAHELHMGFVERGEITIGSLMPDKAS